MDLCPITGKTSSSRRFIKVSACRGDLPIDHHSHHLRATFSKLLRIPAVALQFPAVWRRPLPCVRPSDQCQWPESCELQSGVRGLGEIHKRIFAQSHKLFFAIEPIAPAPQLRSSRIDQQKQAIAVIHLEWFLRGFVPRIAVSVSATLHLQSANLGRTPLLSGIVPQSIPHIFDGSTRTSANAFRRLIAHKSLNYRDFR